MTVRALSLSVRSLRESTRSKVPNLLRGLLIGSLILAVWVAQQNPMASNVGGAMLLTWVAWSDYILICVLAVSAFSAVITEEKELMSLGLLRLAGYTPASILLGKSIGLLVNVLLLIVVQVPFCMLAVTLGGVSIDQIFGIYAMLFAFTFFVYALALLCSVMRRRSSSASRMTVAALLAYHLVPPILGSFVTRWSGISVQGRSSTEVAGFFDSCIYYVQWFLAECSSTSAFVGIVELTSRTATLRMGVGTASFLPHTIVNASAGAVLFLIAWLSFDWFNRNELPSAPARPGLFSRVKQGKRRGGRVFANALLWKDFIFLSGGRRWIVIRIVAYGLVVGLFVYGVVPTRVTPEVFGQVMMSAMLVAFPIEIGVQAGRVFALEVKSKTLGSLIALPLPLSRIILSKAAGAALIGLPAVGYFGLGVLLAPKDFFDGFEDIVSEPGAWYFTSQIVLVWFLAAYLSLRVRRGGFPLAVASVFLGNVIAGMLLSAIAFRSGGDTFDAMAVFGVLATMILCFALGNGVVSAMRRLASEE